MLELIISNSFVEPWIDWEIFQANLYFRQIHISDSVVEILGGSLKNFDERKMKTVLFFNIFTFKLFI